MHQDNFEFDDYRKAWTKAHKKDSIPGDDRSPAWSWLGCVYHDDVNLCIPVENIMAMLRDAGKSTMTGKGQGSFKAQTQSGIRYQQAFWTFKCNGVQIPWAPLEALREDNALTFKEHCVMADAAGFSLFAKRARVKTNKHVRVRPKFNNWTCTGTIEVTDDTLTQEVLEQIFTTAGQLKGLGDWRPGGATPGIYGCFEAKIEQL